MFCWIALDSLRLISVPEGGRCRDRAADSYKTAVRWNLHGVRSIGSFCGSRHASDGRRWSHQDGWKDWGRRRQSDEGGSESWSASGGRQEKIAHVKVLDVHWLISLRILLIFVKLSVLSAVCSFCAPYYCELPTACSRGRNVAIKPFLSSLVDACCDACKPKLSRRQKNLGASEFFPTATWDGRGELIKVEVGNDWLFAPVEWRTFLWLLASWGRCVRHHIEASALVRTKVRAAFSSQFRLAPLLGTIVDIVILCLSSPEKTTRFLESSGCPWRLFLQNICSTTSVSFAVEAASFLRNSGEVVLKSLILRLRWQ